MPNLVDLSREPDTTASLPEWAWWQFNIDDVTAGKGDLMTSITDATDPDLSRFLLDNGGKLLLYHGWSDTGTVPAATVAYYNNVSSRPGESHPQALLEPDVNLAAHPAPSVQPT